MGDPLHVTEETLPARERCLSIVRQIVQPSACFFDCLMLRLPTIPCGAIVVCLHQNPEKCVVGEPRRLLLTKCSEFRSPFFAGVSREIRKRFFQQAPL